MGAGGPPGSSFCHLRSWTEVTLGADAVNPAASTMRSLERALSVMKVLEQSRRPVRLSEIARHAALHVATTQRILRVLERFGYVCQGASGYTIGVSSLLNAHAFLVSNALVRGAMPVLQELADACNLTAALSVRVGLSKVLIGRVDASNPLRYQLPVGERMPLHLGAGRVLAASMEPNEIAELIAEVGEIRQATGELLSTDDFTKRLAEIREQGYVVTSSERVLGGASVGVPVVDLAAHVIAMVQVSGLTEHFDTTRIDWYVAELKRAAAAIAARVS